MQGQERICENNKYFICEGLLHKFEGITTNLAVPQRAAICLTEFMQIIRKSGNMLGKVFAAYGAPFSDCEYTHGL
jgi:hypothetical protein